MSNAQDTTTPASEDDEVLTLADECPICFRETGQVTCSSCGQSEVVYDCNCWYGPFIQDADGLPVHSVCAAS